MKVVIQRVQEASVTIDGNVYSFINKGLVVLVGIELADNSDDISWLANKIVQLRIFNDASNLMNQSLLDVNGELLVVSQFTLHAATKKGNRPSFMKAASPEIAIPLYEDFVKVLRVLSNSKVATGVFGADMKVSLVNDGPVTIVIDSKNKE